MGTCGYKTAEPKWKAKLDKIEAKGIVPQTKPMGRRATNWIFGHGGDINEETGEVIAPPAIAEPKKKIFEALEDVEHGRFVPDRENDVLTKALQNKEHPGRTRGLGPSYPWIRGFPDDVESYRSRERGKKRMASEEAQRLLSVESACSELRDIVKTQQQQLQQLMRTQGSSHQEQPLLDNSGPSQRRSSVASTAVGDNEAPMGGYPVDGVNERTPCELHQSMKNLSWKVAVGYALPCQPRASITARFQLATLVSGWMKLQQDVSHWTLTSLDRKERRNSER
jgi:hypothetical protein